jgi:hypothetical protein
MKSLTKSKTLDSPDARPLAARWPPVSAMVRKIHTGYSGPATGDHYTQFVAEFKSTLDQLLAES